MAATLVFSTLMLSNLTLFAAATQRERLSLTVNSESLLSDTATVLGGTVGLGLLESLQNFLSAGPVQCSNAAQTLDNYSSSLSDSGILNGTYVKASMSPGEDGYEPDNFSILNPFNGSEPGALNVELTIRWSGSSPLNDASYSKLEVHRLHLPVRFGLMDTFCNDSVGQVESLLEGQTFGSCVYSAIEPPLGVLATGLQSQASAEGLTFSLTDSVDNSHGCAVSFTIVVEQRGAAGPDGAFNPRLEQNETVPVQVGE